MKNFIVKTSLSLFLGILSSGYANAQSTVFNPNKINPKFLKMTTKEKEQAQRDFQKQHPLLALSTSLYRKPSDFPMAGRRVISVPQQRRGSILATANPRTILWGNLIYNSATPSAQNGYYSYNPTDSIIYSLLYKTNDQSVGGNGVQYVNGHIYGLQLDFSYEWMGVIVEDLYDINTETGEVKSEQLDSKQYMDLGALETAQASDGTVYGVFYNKDANGIEWGTVDYTTKTRTTIGPATNYYVALGITREGQLYGVAENGNFYKIDKTNGTETLVGPTGLQLLNTDGRYYNQTGEIDQKDNTFYWSAIDNKGNGGLYEINLETGAATLIAPTQSEVIGMIIPAPEAADGAPAKVTDITGNFTGANLSGTISFTVPTQRFDGGQLTGNVNYTVKGNDQVLATGTSTPGATVNASVTVPTSGNYDFVVTTSNAAGESPKAKATQWVGYDIPLAPTNVKISEDNGNVTVSWTSPKTGTHNGTLGTLAYDVYRISGSDSTLVASNIADTVFNDQVSAASLKTYSYTIKAKSEGFESGFSKSNDFIVLGDAIEPDWTDNFDNANDFTLYTVSDANGDGSKWHLNPNGYAQSDYNANNGNDDWLYTPPIHLKADRLYTVSFKAREAYSWYNNTFEVKWGDWNAAHDMTHTLLPTTKPDGEYTVYKFDIRPEEEGNYYIGFHDNTEQANQDYIAIDSIVVKNGALGTSPDSVNNLKVTPGSYGALSATISFNTPKLTIFGDNINSVDSFLIQRDGVTIAKLGRAASGDAVSYTDNDVKKSKVYEYTVIPYTSGNFGRCASASAYIGEDTPNEPQNLALIDNTNNILGIWGAAEKTGPNGGYVNPSHVSLAFFGVSQGYFGPQIGDSITSSERGATRIDLPQDPNKSVSADGQTQSLYEVAARADNDEGSSKYVISDAVIVGPAISLPFKESFTNGVLNNGFAWTSSNEQFHNRATAAGWQMNTQGSADNDGGSAVWNTYPVNTPFGNQYYTIASDDEVSLNSPKISLAGVSNPKLFFSLNATSNDPASLQVKVQDPAGVSHLAKTFDLTGTTKGGWTTQSVDLTPWASERYIVLQFNGVASGSDAYIGLDNVNVIDQKDYDLAATGIKTPKQINAGKTGDVDVTLQNLGAHPASGFDVVLYANDKAVDTLTVNNEVGVFETDTVHLKLPVAVNQNGELKVKAVISYPQDLDVDNNTTESNFVSILASQYSRVTDLSAEANSDGIKLNWTRPEGVQPVETTEDFEAYDAFSTELGDWTLVNGDEGYAGALFPTVSYPGQGTKFAFDAFNPNAITTSFDVVANNPGLAPHSGEQFAGAPYGVDNSRSSYIKANNWLISPELLGNEQTITFYALNVATSDFNYPESFDVLYSTTSKDTTSFVKIESDVADGTTVLEQGVNWKKFSVTLPAGAKYFAIHHYTEGDSNLLFGLDDITYEKASIGSNDSIVGYNLYRDGKLIGTVKGNTVTFTDKDADNGTYIYNVTVLYQDSEGNINESGFSNDASITVTGIENIEANSNGTYNVYTVDGKLVLKNAKSLNGLQRGLYVINDKKYIVK